MLHLDPGEKIIYEVRKHWFVFLSYGLTLIFLAIAPVFLFEIGFFFLPFDITLPAISIEVAILLYIFWLLVLWISFFIHWTNYYLDVWYVTDRRIIDIEQKGMFHREISNLRFDKIQDVTVNVNGVLATFLDHGNLKVQTASESSKDFFMSHASKPNMVRKVIFAAHNKVSDSYLKE